MWLPEEDKYTNRKNELLASLSVSMGGRVAEEIIFGDITNGARGDIRGATAIARRMVCEWGMSEKMGMVEYGEHEDYVFLGRDISRARDYSEATAEQIDQEVRRLIDDSYQLAKHTLITNRDTLETIAKALLESWVAEAAGLPFPKSFDTILGVSPPLEPWHPRPSYSIGSAGIYASNITPCALSKRTSIGFAVTFSFIANATQAK